MKFYIAEDPLRYFISYTTVKRNHHRIRKRILHKFLNNREVLTHKRSEVAGLRAEAQGYSEFKEKTYVKIAEIRIQRIEKEDVLHTPSI